MDSGVTVNAPRRAAPSWSAKPTSSPTATSTLRVYNSADERTRTPTPTLCSQSRWSTVERIIGNDEVGDNARDTGFDVQVARDLTCRITGFDVQKWL